MFSQLLLLAGLRLEEMFFFYDLSSIFIIGNRVARRYYSYGGHIESGFAATVLPVVEIRQQLPFG